MFQPSITIFDVATLFYPSWYFKIVDASAMPPQVGVQRTIFIIAGLLCSN
jgi:hypothetical protein